MTFTLSDEMLLTVVLAGIGYMIAAGLFVLKIYVEQREIKTQFKGFSETLERFIASIGKLTDRLTAAEKEIIELKADVS